jgi:SAM-dependent methyltransferase
MRSLGRTLRKARNQLFKVVFAGDGCSCVYCGKSYRRFLHQGVRAEVFAKHRVSGAGYRKNVRCPNCGSNHRSRLLFLFFKHRTSIFSEHVRVLHVSPRRQLAYVFLRHDNIDFVCGALFPAAYADLDAVEVDVTKIGFEDEGFDVVICNHVLEHVPEDAKAMGEIYRVLKPGGYAVLQVPLALDLETTLEDPTVVDETERKRLYGQKDHVRLYGLDYFDRLTDAGFRVERDNPFKNQWIPDLDRYCLDSEEDVFLGFKG